MPAFPRPRHSHHIMSHIIYSPIEEPEDLWGYGGLYTRTLFNAVAASLVAGLVCTGAARVLERHGAIFGAILSYVTHFIILFLIHIDWAGFPDIRVGGDESGIG